MSPYEIVCSGGSAEHWNEEAGQMWMQRLPSVYAKSVWPNPTPPQCWDCSESTHLLHRLMGGRMFPLTLEGLDGAMRELRR